MELSPIIITARSGNWRKFHGRKGNPAFKALKEKVLQRDDYICRYCGFYAKEFQEVVNFDQNYSNNNFNNLYTACCFCAQCFFLDSLGIDDNSGGDIVYLPEISQADLNNICRVLFCSLDKETPYKSKLQSVYLSLKDRTKEVEDCFGPDSSQPRVFGQALVDCKISEEEMHHNLMHHLRLLPQRKMFQPQIDYWKESVFAHIPL